MYIMKTEQYSYLITILKLKISKWIHFLKQRLLKYLQWIASFLTTFNILYIFNIRLILTKPESVRSSSWIYSFTVKLENMYARLVKTSEKDIYGNKHVFKTNKKSLKCKCLLFYGSKKSRIKLKKKTNLITDLQ